MSLLRSPRRELIIIIALLAGFGAQSLLRDGKWLLLGIAVIGCMPTMWRAGRALRQRRLSIDVFNTFALIVAFATGEVRSSAFIALMLTVAALLGWNTERRTHRALEALLHLKPAVAKRKTQSGSFAEVPVDDVRVGDIVVVETGARVPVDGIVMYGEAQVNEAPVTGESMPVKKVVGDPMVSTALVESGVVQLRATHVGKDSTLAKMAELISAAGRNKSQPERLADRFAGIFLPIVLVLGAVTYIITHNIVMTASLFLVACADDMAVAIPLAVTAALGRAAQRGVLLKGGERLSSIAAMSTLALDKTGTLTLGTLGLGKVACAPGVDEQHFWRMIAIAEKYSEHPVGRMLVHAAQQYIHDVPDPEKFAVVKGAGVTAQYQDMKIAIGTEKLFIAIPKVYRAVQNELERLRLAHDATAIAVVADNQLLGSVTVAETIRAEAKESIAAIRAAGVKRIILLTGDTKERAQKVAAALGIQDVRASLRPEEKLAVLDTLTHEGTTAMIGDGINDAPALARADIGIAMGDVGTAVAVESADVVILNDDLRRIPEIIMLSRTTLAVIRWDMIIWFVSNLIGFMLVLTGVAGLVGAAIYNFATDFFPILNSARLFSRRAFETAKKV